jgi:hypothetical protein
MIDVIASIFSLIDPMTYKECFLSHKFSPKHKISPCEKSNSWNLYVLGKIPKHFEDFSPSTYEITSEVFRECEWNMRKLSEIVDFQVVRENLGNISIGNGNGMIYGRWSWDWDILSENALLEGSDLFLDLPFNWSRLSMNKKSNCLAKKFPDRPWNWKILSRSMDFAIDDLVRLPIDWGCLSLNHHIDFSLVRAFQKKPWDWKRLCCFKGITVDDLDKFPVKYDLLSEYAPIDLIIKEIDRPWNWAIVNKRI